MMLTVAESVWDSDGNFFILAPTTPDASHRFAHSGDAPQITWVTCKQLPRNEESVLPYLQDDWEHCKPLDFRRRYNPFKRKKHLLSKPRVVPNELSVPRTKRTPTKVAARKKAHVKKFSPRPKKMP